MPEYAPTQPKEWVKADEPMSEASHAAMVAKAAQQRREHEARYLWNYDVGFDVCLDVQRVDDTYDQTDGFVDAGTEFASMLVKVDADPDFLFGLMRKLQDHLEETDYYDS
tara:strand:- start:130 stop:459 length:330 start_codon:yes stop_codon:yes gene_type:complete